MRRTLLLLLLLVPLFTLRLGAPGFWEKDEARYAQAAREMRRSGDLLVPTLGGEVRLNKPPLLYWLIAASQAALGETELASRLPSALAGILTSLLVFALARRLAGERAGLFAALVHATAALSGGLGRLAHPESLLVLGVTAALFLFHLSYREDFERRGRLVLMWLAMGLGFLTKGPHAIILPLLVIAVFLALRRDLRAFRRLMPLRGLLLALAPVLVWGGLVVLRQGWGAAETWWVETQGRYFGAVDHPEPPWFFLPRLAGGFLPWTLWLPAAFAVFRRRGERPAGGLFLLVWALAALVFFSLGRSKTAAYALSSVPPLSVAVGVALARLRPGGALRLLGALNAAALAALAGAAAFLRPFPRELAANPLAAAALGVTLAAVLLAVAWAALRGRARATARIAVLGFAAVFVGAVALLAPAANPLHSVREAGRAVAGRIAPGDLFVNLESRRAALVWYADHPVVEGFRFREVAAIWDGPRRIFAFADERKLARLERRGKTPRIVWSRPGAGYLVLTNR